MVEGLAMIPGLYTYAATAIVAGAACLALSIALFFTYTAKHAAERRADKAELTLSQDRAAAATANAQLVQKARETEQSLTAKAAQIEGEKNEQITALDARAADLRKRLRNAEASAATARLVSRAGAAPADAETEPRSNIAGFSDELGSRLISEAERGEKIRISLLACYKQYDGAREALSR